MLVASTNGITSETKGLTQKNPVTLKISPERLV